jgi:hypothetical protein
VLLWSNYGAKKAAGIYGTAFFGFSFILGVFWWFGGPGIPPNLGITNAAGPGRRPLRPGLVRVRARQRPRPLLLRGEHDWTRS